MAEIKAKLSNNRNDLSEVLPLKTPYVIQIDPSSRCNFKCKFCPTGNDDENSNIRTLMDFELFKKIINDLVNFNEKIKSVKLWKDGEPLLNSNISQMIKYAKKKEVAEKIELTTNGYLLNKTISDKLIESGLDKIIISVEGLNEEDYLKNSGVKINYNDFINNIKYFYNNRKQCIVHIKIIDVNMSESDRNTFYNKFNNISDEMFIEKAIPCWPDFEDSSITHNLSNVWGNSIEKKEICPLPLYSLVVNANGNVSMCCNDWKQQIIVGDAKKNTLKEIWYSDKVRSFQILQLSKKRQNVYACSKCMYPDYVAIDNIDNKSQQILDKYL